MLKYAIHVFVLSSFAVAQPLLDLLSRNEEFFVARGSEPEDVLSFVFLVSLAQPLMLVAIQKLFHYLNQKAYIACHGFIIFILAVAIFLQIFGKFRVEGFVLLSTAAVSGALFVFGYFSLLHLQRFLTVLAPAVLIFPGLFFINPGILKIVFPKKPVSCAAVQIKDPPPIIMVVFDEFPVTALLDDKGRIDRHRFPNFFRLAESSYWFRNATSLAAQTLLVLPSIVTGNHPNPKLQPTAADHPHSFFTLLAGTYHMKVFEPKSQLCPPELCKRGIAQGVFRERMKGLMEDSAIVYAHLILPGDLGRSLPVITQDWGDFVSGDHATMSGFQRGEEVRRDDRIGQFKQFVESVSSMEQPALNFMHIVLPHRKWEYLPSGKRYDGFSKEEIWDFFARKKIGSEDMKGTAIGDRAAEIWGEDEWFIQQAYQSFLLQIGFVDNLVGELLDRLEEIHLYERSLLIVTADHGMSFRINNYTRIATETNSGDVLSIPLFIKAPYQVSNATVDRKVESADILPTMADIIGISLPWTIDGHSALDPIFRASEYVQFLNPDGKFTVSMKSLRQINEETLKWKLDLFGSGADSRRLYEIGP